MVEQDDFTRAPAVPLAEVRFEAAFPVAVSDAGGAGRDSELARHEVVVRHRIGGEVREVAEREALSASSRALSWISSPTFHEWQCRPTGAYFFAMLVSAAIEPYRNSYRIVSEKLGDRPRKLRERSEHGLAEEDVRARRPRPRGRGKHAQRDHDERQRDRDPRMAPALLSCGRSSGFAGSRVHPRSYNQFRCRGAFCAAEPPFAGRSARVAPCRRSPRARCARTRRSSRRCRRRGCGR